jgi:Uma2 family endonuclease
MSTIHSPSTVASSATLPRASSIRLLTVADLAALPEALPTGPVRYELYQGHLQIMSPAGHRHGGVQNRTATHLTMQGEFKGLGRIFTETAVVISRNPDTVLVPDACFIANDRLPLRESSEGYLETIPTLAVEVRSKNDTLAELTRKAEIYLQAGAEMTWIVDQHARNVVVITPNSAAVTFGENAELPAPPGLPGFALIVAKLFD